MLDFLIHYIAPYFNFCLFVAIVVYFGKKPIREMFQLKRDAYSKDAELSKADFDKVAIENNALRERLKNLKQEVEQLKANNQKTIDSFIVQSKQQASDQVDQIKSEMERTIVTEFNLKKRQINKQLVDSARSLLLEKLNTHDSKELKDRFLENAIKELHGSKASLSSLGGGNDFNPAKKTTAQSRTGQNT